MNTMEKWVTTTDALVAAIKDESIVRIVVSGWVRDVPSLYLSPGRSLCGAAEDTTIVFVGGTDGLELSSDNSICNLHLCVAPEKRAIFNDTAMRRWRSALISSEFRLGAKALRCAAVASSSAAPATLAGE